MRCQVGKNTIIYIYGHYILSDGCYILSFRYNLVCVAHYLLPYRYDSLSYQYNFQGDAYFFFCYNQNSFCHAFYFLGHEYNLFCYSNYSLCDIYYCQCCTLNFLSVVHHSANNHCHFGVLVQPHDSLGHSYNSAWAVHISFCDLNKIICHPYYYAKWASSFSFVISICCWVSEQW